MFCMISIFDSCFRFLAEVKIKTCVELLGLLPLIIFLGALSLNVLVYSYSSLFPADESS